jgi:hypothetical protein
LRYIQSDVNKVVVLSKYESSNPMVIQLLEENEMIVKTHDGQTLGVVALSKIWQ